MYVFVMEFFIPLVAFLGLFVGILMKKYVSEEVKVGEKYFVVGEKIILLTLTVYILNTVFTESFYSYTFFLIGFVAGLLFRQPYLYLGLALTTFDFVVAALTFIFGITYGRKRSLGITLIFFVPFLILFFSVDFVYALITASGAFFAMVITKNHKAY